MQFKLGWYCRGNDDRTVLCLSLSNIEKKEIEDEKSSKNFKRLLKVMSLGGRFLEKIKERYNDFFLLKKRNCSISTITGQTFGVDERRVEPEAMAKERHCWVAFFDSERKSNCFNRIIL